MWAKWADWACHWLSLFFCRFFETIYDPLSEIPCPIGPNVNRWAVPGASREPTFSLNVTCVGQVGRLCMPLASEPTFSINVTCVGQVGRLGMPLAFPIFCRFFETIHDPLSEIPCPLGPNVNSWAALGASREPTFSFNMTCVGTVGRLGMPLDFPIFLLIF